MYPEWSAHTNGGGDTNGGTPPPPQHLHVHHGISILSCEVFFFYAHRIRSSVGMGAVGRGPLPCDCWRLRDSAWLNEQAPRRWLALAGTEAASGGGGEARWKAERRGERWRQPRRGGGSGGSETPTQPPSERRSLDANTGVLPPPSPLLTCS